jgi:hypothetical protein
MKAQLLIRLMIVIFYFGQNMIFAQKIYLSPAGNENNPGTIEKPLATLNAARDKAREYGKRAVRARTPNDGFYFVKSVTETVMEKGAGRAPELAMQKIELDSTDAACFQSFSTQDYQDALFPVCRRNYHL